MIETRVFQRWSLQVLSLSTRTEQVNCVLLGMRLLGKSYATC
jgi:hypothetical protein